ncbi:hypothetical protein AX17_004516 [Amanita inopinata Kibby_2008]|nr:hypothetical protein AX17_004516 [Amanita inopinata Kibby_2008]
MDSVSTSSRPRTYEAPKPEADLAEWTNKIKALQRQVDADDEAEQKRLEEEIAAARKARLRRSRGAGSVSVVDVSRPDREISARHDPPLTVTGRDAHEADALRRLAKSGASSSTMPGTALGPEKKLHTGHTKVQQSVSEKRGGPVSLAAFIGGRASGPRLNKHAPQQDAADPTQFDQRTTITAPHPIFGRGGIAVPGLAGQRSAVTHTGVASDADERYRPSINRRSPALSTTRKYVEQIEGRSVASERAGNKENVLVSEKTGEKAHTVVAQRSGNKDQAIFPKKAGDKELPIAPQKTGTRERAISTPAPSHPAKDNVRSASGSSERKVSQYSSTRPTSPSKDRNVPPLPVATPFVSRHSFSSSQTGPTPYKMSTPTSHLARPIQPDLRPPSQSSTAPSSNFPSPAFKKSPAQKEPTPSISRLHGRGFVQNMVKKSTQLESSVETPPTPPLKPRAIRARKSSVLDRWQPVLASSSPSPPPPVSPKPVSLHKTHSTHPAAPVDTARRASTEPTKRFLRTRASLPSISQGFTEATGAELERNASLLKKMPPDGAPGLGSATTMAIYKPSPSPVETDFTNVDELGVRRKSVLLNAEDAGRIRVATDLPSPPGKPLSHPTKDRAKRPRKVKNVQPANQVQGCPSKAMSAMGQPEARHAVSRTVAVAQKSEPANVDSLAAIAHRSSGTDKPSLTIASSWTEPSLTTLKSPISEPSPSHEYARRKTYVGRALPGMTSESKVVEQALVASKPKSPQPTSSTREETSTQIAQLPARHSRTPSSGNRPTVMDVALTFSQQTDKGNTNSSTRKNETEVLKKAVPVARSVALPEIKAERRKSTLEKYSSIMLPALKEEVTPVSTPSGTLSRKTVTSDSDTLEKSSLSLTKSEVASIATPDKVVHLDHQDKPLPDVDIDRLLVPPRDIDLSDSHTQTISVDVLNIAGGTGSLISQDLNIFYDTELLAVIHRSKSRIDGLASTTLWIWRGKCSEVGDKEERKIQDLSRRYGTKAVIIQQRSEPPQLVHLLGGQLVIRQGSRSRWSSENTTMHLVRASRGLIYIDELDLAVKNLCSAFSYCLSILNTIYIWYGCGSTEAERQAASNYARSFVAAGQNPVELSESENDEDDMFWMILGGRGFAKADYWKWRRDMSMADPRVWRVEAEQGENSMTPIFSFAFERVSHESVYVIDCIWEYFVLVGREARGYRQDIRLALNVAMTMSKKLSPHRPFPPTVHVLVLPSQLPSDLRLNFRDLDEELLNDGEVPDHMNILSSTEAMEHLQKTSWNMSTLKDGKMLPLGVDMSHIP